MFHTWLLMWVISDDDSVIFQGGSSENSFAVLKLFSPSSAAGGSGLLQYTWVDMGQSELLVIFYVHVWNHLSTALQSASSHINSAGLRERCGIHKRLIAAPLYRCLSWSQAENTREPEAEIWILHQYGPQTALMALTFSFYVWVNQSD